MLKKMRRRFILAAMAAFSLVIVTLLCAVNLWNYHIVTQRQDSTVSRLLEIGYRNRPPISAKAIPVPGPFGPLSPETQHMSRYFSVAYDSSGKVVHINKEFVSSVTEEEGIQWADRVVKGDRQRGYSHGYRYAIAETELGKTVLFLNAEREIQSMKTILLVSVVTAMASLFAVLMLVLAFCDRAIAPYLKNMEVQKEFITNAGHELKTPLTAISASADVLALSMEKNEWVENIQTQAGKLSKLISDLITLSRLEEADPFPEMTEFSLTEALWELSESSGTVAKARGLSLHLSIEDGLTLNGDRAGIQQMVSILMDNALKYTPDGGEILLSAEKRQRKTVIRVCNTCRREDTQQIHRYFDRFYRKDTARTDRNSFGIGLSVAKAIAECHNGTIDASSSTETQFVITVRL